MSERIIKVSEVSEVLRMQLKGITDIKYDETGVVMSVSDGVAPVFLDYAMPRRVNCWSLKTACRLS